MRGVPAWALKASAVCLAVLATVGAADYVGAHVKDQTAPLRPALQPLTGQVTLTQGVRATSAEPVTETHTS